MCPIRMWKIGLKSGSFFDSVLNYVCDWGMDNFHAKPKFDSWAGSFFNAEVETVCLMFFESYLLFYKTIQVTLNG